MNRNTMKSVNIMNFVRQCEPRSESVDKILFETTKKQLALVNELQVPNTFLLQYDALCDDRFVKLFKEEAGPLTETGLWYEIVEPLTSACGMKYESEYGWKWDWHIKPGFSMAYTPDERDRLIDEAMRKYNIVDHPEAIDPEAAQHKGATGRKIVGDADVILFPDIHAGNLVYKTLVHTAKVENGCILTGTKVPVILTSRSDTFRTKVNSIALAAVVAEAMKNA